MPRALRSRSTPPARHDIRSLRPPPFTESPVKLAKSLREHMNLVGMDRPTATTVVAVARHMVELDGFRPIGFERCRCVLSPGVEIMNTT